MSTHPIERVLIAIPGANDHLDALRDAVPGCTIDVIDPFPRGTALPGEMIHDRTVLVADFPPENLPEMTSLRWLQLGSAGYMQLAGLPFETLDVRVTNASGVNDIPIAEWCLMMMLALRRDLPAMVQRQHEHHWDRAARFQSELRGQRVGIIGYGNIGREVARLCQSLGLEVWAMNRTPIGPTPLRYVPPGSGDPEGRLPQRAFAMNQMDEFLPHLDFLVLTMALNPATHGLLGARQLRMLPDHAVILNPARAHLIDEDALRQALEEQWISGLALDSHYREPLTQDDPTWDLPNVILTPHISGSTLSPHYAYRLWHLLATNLQRFRGGDPLLNEIPWSDLEAPRP